jgi:2-C-methyl-D-erythritol 4-phosphate cytidylyltransferase
MGGAVSKQYLSINGRPILSHTIALFDAHPRIDHIYIIAPAEQIEFCHTQCIAPYSFTKVRSILSGGRERQDSVRNGLDACGAHPDDTIIIHDGVRPLFPAEQIDAVLTEVARSGACVVGVPVKDTIKQVSGTLISATPQRASLWAAHTPQAFRYELIAAAHRQAAQSNYYGTDDASLLEWQGISVTMLEGSYRNIKITTPEDLLIAQALTDNQKQQH